jgi:hypothetical protein
MPSSLPRWNGKVRLSLASPATLAFPECPTGRLPHQSFRGLIERSLTLRPASSRSHQVTLSIEGSDGFVASSVASIATGQATLPRRDFHPLEYTRIHGARTSLIIRCSARPPGSAKRERKPQTRRGPPHPCLRPEGPVPLNTGSYLFQLFIVQFAIDPGNPVPRAFRRPGAQWQLLAAARPLPRSGAEDRLMLGVALACARRRASWHVRTPTAGMPAVRSAAARPSPPRPGRR